MAALPTAALPTVVLKDGSHINRLQYWNTYQTIGILQLDDHEIFCELIKKCQNPKFKLNKNFREYLCDHGLIHNREITSTTRRIIENGIKGSESSFKLHNPLLNQETYPFDSELSKTMDRVDKLTKEMMQDFKIYCKTEELAKTNYFAFCELVEKCENDEYEFVYDDSKEILIMNGLMDESEGISENIKDSVLNSVEGSGFERKFISASSCKPQNPYLIQFFWIQLLGGIYLLYLSLTHLFPRSSRSKNR